jgi:hypothetical protein
VLSEHERARTIDQRHKNNRPGGTVNLVTISQVANTILQTIFIAVIGLGY